MYRKVNNVGSPRNMEDDKTAEHQATVDDGNADQRYEGMVLIHKPRGIESSTATNIEEDENDNATVNAINTSVAKKKP